MTFEEISAYFWKTIFNKETIERVNKNLLKKTGYYKKEYNKWKWKQNKDSQYKIFKPETFKGKFDETLIYIPYSSGKVLDFVCFVVFTHRNRKYVAMKLINKNHVFYYSWHAIQRYIERFLQEQPNDIEIDNSFLGELLIYNTQSIKTSYEYKGIPTIMYIVNDGAFLCIEEGNSVIAKTFISQEEYFKNQELLDAEALEAVRERKKKYGQLADRDF